MVSKTILSLICAFSLMPSLCYGRVNPNFRVKAVNLGGWLVTEGWIKPSLFDGIPNKDFLVCHGFTICLPILSSFLSHIAIYIFYLQDGTEVQFKSVTIGKYLCAETGGGTIIVVNRTTASGWETFRVNYIFVQMIGMYCLLT